MGTNGPKARGLGVVIAACALLAGATTASAEDLAIPELELRAAGGELGDSVATDGEVIVAGAPSVGSAAGAAYVFRRSGESWVEEATLRATPAHHGDRFGWQVAVFGDTIAVTAPFFDGPEPDSGALYIFERNQDGWRQVAARVPDDGKRHCGFGRSLEIAPDMIFVGAHCDFVMPAIGGSVFVFSKTASGWEETSRLMPRVVSAPDRFGTSLAYDGNALVVGASSATHAEVGAGAVYVFTNTAGGWVETTKLVASDAGRFDSFGIAVDIDGNSIVVGADRDDDHGYNSGAAYLFVRTPDGWSEAAKFASADSKQADGFGNPIRIQDRTVAVTRGYDDVHDLEPGAVYVFTTAGNQVREIGRITAGDGGITDLFGEAISLTDRDLTVGARYHSHGGGGQSGRGAVYVYDIADLSIPCSIVGTAGDDVLVGTPGPDVICGFAGSDVIYGSGGDDILRGGPGDDEIYGGFGFDWLSGGAGDDRLIGGAQGDVAIGGPGDDVLRGKAGDDWLEGNRGTDRLWGGPGDDTLHGGQGSDRCDGGLGINELISCN